MTVLRLPDVLKTTGLSRSTTYAMIAQGEFPAPIRLGRRAVGWIEDEVVGWLSLRIESRDN